MRSSLLQRGAAIPPPTQPTGATKGSIVPPAVLRSLYRSLLKEARVLDKNPLLKAMLPLSKPFQQALGTDRSLYQPGEGVTYDGVVRQVFHREAPPTSADVTAAFDALNRLRYHNKEVTERFKETTREREQLAAALKLAMPKDGSFHAKVLQPTPLSCTSETTVASAAAAVAAPHGERSSASSIATAAHTTGAPPVTHIPDPSKPQRPSTSGAIRVVPSNVAVKKTHVELKPGVALIAHPLSSAHSDRRVMLITSKTHHTTTALVLDMLYSFPLSEGNPMFPEVFWGHEIYNGGFLHVDFTMPPTACVTVLHTLAPPPAATTASFAEEAQSPQYNHAWLRWMRGSESGTGNHSAADKQRPPAASPHEILCKPLIRGAVRPDGTTEPTLYVSSVEALPYLSTIAAGQPRSQVRIYWGCMRWPTTQIHAEVASGHWIPVEVSPSFFAGFPDLHLQGGASKGRSSRPGAGGVSRSSSNVLIPKDERFPTAEEIVVAKELRLRLAHTDAIPPQVFPPDQPMCRRETLWDQILTSLGGDFEHLVGCSNPFSSKKEGPRAPPVEILSDDDTLDLTKLPLSDAIPLLLGDDDDDDGDDDE